MEPQLFDSPEETDIVRRFAISAKVFVIIYIYELSRGEREREREGWGEGAGEESKGGKLEKGKSEK